MRAWSFAAIGVIVIQSVLMLAYGVYADTSTSSRFRLQDSFSVVGDGRGSSSTYRIRDRAGESAPTTFISRTLHGVTTGKNYLVARLFAESRTVEDVSQPTVTTPEIMPTSSPTKAPHQTPPALPFTQRGGTEGLTPAPSVPAGAVVVPPTPTPDIREVTRRRITPLVEPMAAPVVELLRSGTEQEGSGRRITVPTEGQELSQADSGSVKAPEAPAVVEPSTPPLEPLPAKPPYIPLYTKGEREGSKGEELSPVQKFQERIVNRVVEARHSIFTNTQSAVKSVTQTTQQSTRSVTEKVHTGFRAILDWFQGGAQKIRQWWKSSFNATQQAVAWLYELNRPAYTFAGTVDNSHQETVGYDWDDVAQDPDDLRCNANLYTEELLSTIGY